MYSCCGLQVGSESLAARILGPAAAAGSKQSIDLGRIFRARAWRALCKTTFVQSSEASRLSFSDALSVGHEGPEWGEHGRKTGGVLCPYVCPVCSVPCV